MHLKEEYPKVGGLSWKELRNKMLVWKGHGQSMAYGGISLSHMVMLDSIRPGTSEGKDMDGLAEEFSCFVNNRYYQKCGITRFSLRVSENIKKKKN